VGDTVTSRLSRKLLLEPPRANPNDGKTSASSVSAYTPPTCAGGTRTSGSGALRGSAGTAGTTGVAVGGTSTGTGNGGGGGSGSAMSLLASGRPGRGGKAMG